MKNPIRKWTDKLNGKWENIIISLCEIVVGILILIKPLKFTAGIIAAAGIMCVLLGLKYGVKYFRMDIIRASSQRDFFKALVMIGSGVFLVFGSGWLSATQQILNIVYGIALLLLSAEKVQWAVNLLRWQKPYWYVTGISAVLTVVMAILMLLNPFPGQIVWIVLGISLIAEAILDMVALFFSEKKTKVHPVEMNVSKSDTQREKKSKKSEEKLEKSIMAEVHEEKKLEEMPQEDVNPAEELQEKQTGEADYEAEQNDMQTEEVTIPPVDTE